VTPSSRSFKDKVGRGRDSLDGDGFVDSRRGLIETGLNGEDFREEGVERRLLLRRSKRDMRVLPKYSEE
jgi:hypothetical protein